MGLRDNNFQNTLRQSKHYRDDLNTMEDMIIGAVTETITPGKGPVTMETENITMTMAVTKLQEILGLTS